MQGKIIKGIAGFYYVHVAESGIYECKAKGAFRNQKVKPLVGDNIRLDVLDEEEKKGNIEEILPRKNELIRPAVANIDQALVIFAAAKPKPNFNLLDRFLILMQYQKVPAVVSFNKQDMVNEEELKLLRATYESADYPVLFTSAAKEEGIQAIRELLKGKTTTVAGPSGVGNSIYLPDMEKEELGTYFPEFAKYEPFCRFQGCAHIHEPGCGVKEALEEKKISPIRYENYKLLYEELKDKRRY